MSHFANSLKQLRIERGLTHPYIKIKTERIALSDINGRGGP